MATGAPGPHQSNEEEALCSIKNKSPSNTQEPCLQQRVEPCEARWQSSAGLGFLSLQEHPPPD